METKRTTTQPETIPIKATLSPERIQFVKETTKDAALLDLVDLLSLDDHIHDRAQLLKEIYRREELMSTGIGMGIGVPHVRIDSVDDIVMAVGVCPDPIPDYESLDGEPVQIICMIAANTEQHTKHIKLLSAVAKLLKDTTIRNKILQSKSRQEIFEIFTGAKSA